MNDHGDELFPQGRSIEHSDLPGAWFAIGIIMVLACVVFTLAWSLL